VDCGPWPSGITGIARQPTATLRRARPPWLDSQRAGGASDLSGHGRASVPPGPSCLPELIAAPALMPVAYIVCPKNCTHCSKVMAQKLREWNYGQAAVHRVFTPMLRPKLPRRGDDRVSGTDAERDDDIYHNGTSGFGGNAARGEMADLSRVLINAQISAPAIITPTLHVQKNSLQAI
jgi:hypothetical protein